MDFNPLCIIQARLGSARFPEKVIAKIDGVPMIVRIYKLISTVCKTIVAIPYTESKTLGTFLWSHSVPFYEGHPDNVLDRYFQATLRFPQYNYFMRITGDCPAPNLPLVCNILNNAQLENLDFISNCFLPRTWPDGDDCELMSLRGLIWLYDKVKEQGDKEHVCTYIYSHLTEANKDGLTMQAMYNTWDASHIKTSIDTEDELEAFRARAVTLKTIFQRGNKCMPQ